MKPISIDQASKNEFLNAIMREITEQLNSCTKTSEIHINKKYTPRLPKPENDAIINFSALAWLKMCTLIENTSEECAWHGVVETNEERTIFNVLNILVYPQRINNATVEDDDPKYEIWHQALDDYTYNHLRLQGHSHVNMTATPSGRDDSTYNAILQALSNNSYYIFMIANKRGNIWANIYDLKNNRIWEQTDIAITVENIDLYAWYKNAKDTYFARTSKLERPTFTTPYYKKPAQTKRQTSKAYEKSLDAFFAQSDRMFDTIDEGDYYSR